MWNTFEQTTDTAATDGDKHDSASYDCDDGLDEDDEEYYDDGDDDDDDGCDDDEDDDGKVTAIISRLSMI